MTPWGRYSREEVEALARLGLEEYEAKIAEGVAEIPARTAAYKRIGRESSDRYLTDAGKRYFRVLQKERGTHAN